MTKAKLLIFSIFLGGVLAIPARAQVPTCQINIAPHTDTYTTPFFDNRTTQCTYWVFNYQVTGFSAVSIEVDSASGASAPGSFGLFSGTVTTGSNPSTSVACGTPSNCTIVLTGQVGWYRVAFTTHAGSGSIQGVLKGYPTGYTLGGNSPGGGTGCPSPCPVEGVDAVGAVPTVPPVGVAGFDGTDVRRLSTDASGRPVVVGAAASGAALAGNPVTVCGSDGTDCRTVKTDANGNLQTGAVGFGTFSSGQVAVTGTAGNLGTNTSRAVCVEALPGNTINVFVGAAGVTTGTGLPLQPGQSTCQPVSNTNLIYVVASTTGASVAWTLVN